MTETHVILVDDDEDLRPALEQALELAGFDVLALTDAATALSKVSRSFNGVVVSDIRMPGMDGMALLKALLAIDPALPVVMITGHGDVALAVEAMREGAYDFIEKPFPVQQLSSVVARAAEKRRLVMENRALRQELDGSSVLESRLIGRNPAIVRLRSELMSVADSNADVLIMGETGAGKEVVARALHDLSERSAKPFVAINCGALPSEIFESELFGHASGAFTGASNTRVGRLEHANGGTVFLDEIEAMPLDLQVKLLRAIEQRQIEPLGSNRVVDLDLRFVAASKADLEQRSAEGKFRSDLFYRLNVVTLSIPALRERKDDIPLLFAHLAREARARYRRDMPELTPELEAALMARDWPGNVRELRNYADRWVLGLWNAGTTTSETSSDTSLSDRVAAFEKSVLTAELNRNGGSMKKTYEALGLSRKGLYDKLQRHGLAGSDDG